MRAAWITRSATTAARLTAAAALGLWFLPGCGSDAPPSAGSAAGTACGGAAAGVAAPYIGDRDNRIVHRADCRSAAQMKPGHRVPFDLLANAMAEGYRPCKPCLRAAVTTSAGDRGGSEP